jgi:hypothetical protein
MERELALPPAVQNVHKSRATGKLGCLAEYGKCKREKSLKIICF